MNPLIKVSLSYIQADKIRRQVNKETAADIEDNWVPPSLASLHWDGKGVSTLSDKYSHEERLAVAIGDSQNMKVLGIPSYKTGKNY